MAQASEPTAGNSPFREGNCQSGRERRSRGSSQTYKASQKRFSPGPSARKIDVQAVLHAVLHRDVDRAPPPELHGPYPHGMIAGRQLEQERRQPAELAIHIDFRLPRPGADADVAVRRRGRRADRGLEEPLRAARRGEHQRQREKQKKQRAADGRDLDRPPPRRRNGREQPPPRFAGPQPTSAASAMTRPSEKMSAASPIFPPRACSGAMYPRLPFGPAPRCARSSQPAARATPKSPRYTAPDRESSTLSGATSR